MFGSWWWWWGGAGSASAPDLVVLCLEVPRGLWKRQPVVLLTLAGPVYLDEVVDDGDFPPRPTGLDPDCRARFDAEDVFRVRPPVCRDER